MLSNKYSNILTMLLVVFIVAIIGIIGYFGYDLLNSKSVNDNAQSTLEEFEKAVKRETISKTPANNTTSENTVVSNPLDQLNQMTDVQNTVAAEPQEPEKVYMDGYEVKGRIQIPKTGVDYPILAEVTKKSLEIAVGIAYGPGLNEVGNTIIFGHNYRNGLFFSDNKKLANGDKILITDQMGQTITYSIYNIYQTTPSDAEYFKRDTEGRREITLQTCTDDSSARIIIWAAEVQ